MVRQISRSHQDRTVTARKQHRWLRWVVAGVDLLSHSYVKESSGPNGNGSQAASLAAMGGGRSGPVLVLAVAGTFVFIHFLGGPVPAPLALPKLPAAAAGDAQGR